MKQKGIVFIPLIIIVAAVVVISTAAYLVVTDKVQAPGVLKLLIKETGGLGEPKGLEIKQVGGIEPGEGIEAEKPTPSSSGEGIWELLKNMFSTGYFKKVDTSGQGEGLGEGEFYQQTKEEPIFPERMQAQERCSWEISREDLEKLGLHCSQIIGYYYGPAIVGMPSDEYDCNPVPGCQYDPEIVPFQTKEECESVCGNI